MGVEDDQVVARHEHGQVGRMVRAVEAQAEAARRHDLHARNNRHRTGYRSSVTRFSFGLTVHALRPTLSSLLACPMRAMLAKSSLLNVASLNKYNAGPCSRTQHRKSSVST